MTTKSKKINPTSVSEDKSTYSNTSNSTGKKVYALNSFDTSGMKPAKVKVYIRVDNEYKQAMAYLLNKPIIIHLNK